MLNPSRRCGAERRVDGVEGGQSLLEHEVGHLVHQPAFRAKAIEFAGSARRSVLVAPAHQHFQPVEFARAEIDLGLQCAAEASIADGQAQTLLEPRAFLRAKGEGGFEDAAFRPWSAAWPAPAPRPP